MAPDSLGDARAASERLCEGKGKDAAWTDTTTTAELLQDPGAIQRNQAGPCHAGTNVRYHYPAHSPARRSLACDRAGARSASERAAKAGSSGGRGCRRLRAWAINCHPDAFASARSKSRAHPWGFAPHPGVGLRPFRRRGRGAAQSRAQCLRPNRAREPERLRGREPTAPRWTFPSATAWQCRCRGGG